MLSRGIRHQGGQVVLQGADQSLCGGAGRQVPAGLRCQ